MLMTSHTEKDLILLLTPATSFRRPNLHPWDGQFTSPVRNVHRHQSYKRNCRHIHWPPTAGINMTLDGL
jgi:hypothetical protein